MTSKKISRGAIITFSYLSFVCCAQQKPSFHQTGNYIVTVVSDGEKVSDFNRDLIHRININSKQLDKLKGEINDANKLNLTIDKTLAGEIVGISVVASDYALLETLGLEQEDLITAVNKTRANNTSAIQLFIPTLEADSKASITIQRRGQPHKLLYFLQR